MAKIKFNLELSSEGQIETITELMPRLVSEAVAESGVSSSEFEVSDIEKKSSNQDGGVAIVFFVTTGATVAAHILSNYIVDPVLKRFKGDATDSSES